MLETNGIISQTTVPHILKNWIILLWTANTQRSLSLCLLHNISAPRSLVQIMWGCHTTVCYNLCISKWLGLRLPQRVCLQAAQSPPGEVLIKSETKSFSCSSETRGLHRGRGGVWLSSIFTTMLAIWRTEGSATGSLPEQRQTQIHICIEVVI